MSSTWTTEDLEELEKAIAKGVLKVKYTDKEVTYRSLSEMMAIRAEIRKCLGLCGRGGRIFAKFSRGNC